MILETNLELGGGGVNSWLPPIYKDKTRTCRRAYKVASCQLPVFGTLCSYIVNYSAETLLSFNGNVMGCDTCPLRFVNAC